MDFEKLTSSLVAMLTFVLRFFKSKNTCNDLGSLNFLTITTI